MQINITKAHPLAAGRGERRQRQLGMTLLELLISLSVMGGIVAGITSLVQDAGEDAKASVTALHTKTVGDAAAAYIRDNYATVIAAATPTTPALIRVSDLIATGYLQTGFSVTNPSRQSTCVLVLEPTANRVTGLVITELGETLDDLTLGQVAALIGGAGGGIYSTAPTQVRGAMGGFDVAVGNFGNPNHRGERCDGTPGNITVAAGHPAMALWFADGVQASATLYRSQVPGNPTLNTMETPILMGTGAINTEGVACPTLGAIGRDVSGAVLACENNIWSRAGSAFWQSPVANFAALPVCNAAGLGHTRVVHTPTTGTGQRAYTCNGAGSWVALGVDNAGNFSVAGTANITQLAGVLEITSTQTSGSACAPNGRLARDTNGALLSCVSGTWAGSSGSAPSNLIGYFFAAACPSGWVAANGTGGTPDLRGEFVRGLDSGRGVDVARGLGTFQDHALQNHIHGLSGNIGGAYQVLGSQSSRVAGIGPGAWSESWSYSGAGGGRHVSTPSRPDGLGGGGVNTAAETRPRNIALLACMKS